MFPRYHNGYEDNIRMYFVYDKIWMLSKINIHSFFLIGKGMFKIMDSLFIFFLHLSLLIILIWKMTHF
jgi:hypothetical protein